MPEATATKGIGRGLAAILPQSQARHDGYREIALELIRPNERQPRRELDEEALLGLADSIGRRGVLQPIVVRPLPGGSYELIAGERRLRAAKIAELETIPAIVRESEESERLELALIENVARENLNPVDEARACATLVEDLGITKEELARRLGKSRVAISNLVRLLQLPDGVLAMLEQGQLSEGHGRALLLCKDQDERLRLARDARARSWSVREAEERAKEAARALAGERPPPARAPAMPAHPDLQDAIATAEDALSAALGTDVHIRVMRNRYRAHFELDSPRQGIELAEHLSRSDARPDAPQHRR